MAESIGYITEALSLFDKSIKLAKDIKTYLTPQYKEAALALPRFFKDAIITSSND
jgi:hypothetical protein